jgi:hypothetical protein
MKKLLLPLLVLSAATLNAQSFERCSSYGYMQQQIANDPLLQNRVNQYEAECAQAELDNPNGYQSRAICLIPVVVHVVYQNATENISNTRIYEQIDVLNEDYRKNNADASNIPAAWQGIAADCEIMFCLAARDPNGNWTDGIERVATSTSTFSTNDNVKDNATGGADAWDSDVYMNLWVCDLGSQLLGYAQFPGFDPSTDGVVIHYRYFGKTGAIAPFNKGRTATHEVGHWLGLRHIWGDDGSACSGSDLVSDTPNQADENYGTIAPGTVLTDNCTSSAPGIMWSNYMDYTDDGSMYFFTEGQNTRMWVTLNGNRFSLQSSNGCTAVDVHDITLTGVFSIYPSPTDGIVTLDFGGKAPSDYDITVYNTLGEVVSSQHVEMLHERTLQIDLRSNGAGIYLIEARNATEKAVKRVVVE